MPNSVPTNHALILATALFVMGFAGVMIRRNLVFMLMSVEIMLNAAAIAFIAAAAKWHQADGQVFVIFILVSAAAEVAVGLALVLRIYHYWNDLDADQLDLMKG
jgi:NADH-quinone oxidoreductase subunit K